MVPEAFSVVFDVLVPKLSVVISSMQNPQILTAALSILRTVLTQDAASSKDPKEKPLSKSYLNTIGFQGLPDADSFTNLVLASNRESVVKTAISVIDEIVR